MPAVIAKDPHYGIEEQDPRLSPKHAWAITPSATDDQPYITSAIRAVDAGYMTVDMFGGETNVVLHFAAGETRYVRVRKVKSFTTMTAAEGLA